MENKDEKKPVDEHSAGAVLQRGKAAIEADEEINKAGQDKEAVEKEKKKDAEQWRNEG